MNGRHLRPERPDLRRRIRYRFDNVLARGMWASLVWLGVVTLAILTVSSILLTAFDVTLAGSESQSWLEDFWQTMLRVLDPGTMASDVGWGRRLLALTVTMFGVLVAGTLIGIIASGVEARIERMRRGRSAVVEADHLVVLGHSERLAQVVRQLVLAHAEHGGTTIVVLADRDPSELNDEIRSVVRDVRGSRLVLRAGDPTSGADLGLVRLDRARAVIVLSDAGDDAEAVKSVLAIGGELGGFDRIRTVVELGDPVLGERLARACGGQVLPMVAAQGIGRTAALDLLQPGIGRIVEELLEFGGCDLHVDHRPEVTGLAFGSVVGLYANARPIGRVRGDGTIQLAPPPDVELGSDDRVILIAHDTAALEVLPEDRRHPPASPGPVPPAVEADPGEQHLLVLGWNGFGAQLLANWVSFARPTSTVEIIVDPSLCDAASIKVPGLDQQWVTVSAGNDSPPTVADHVTTILMLGYSDRLTADAADTRTLLDLMVLRRHLQSSDRTPPHVSVELLDAANGSLVDVDANCYVISQALGGQFLAQLAEHPERREVLLALYATDGPSIRLIPAQRLGLVGEVVAADVVARAYRSGLVAFGWRRRMGDGWALALNPRDDAVVELARDDQIVVVG